MMTPTPKERAKAALDAHWKGDDDYRIEVVLANAIRDAEATARAEQRERDAVIALEFREAVAGWIANAIRNQ